jgi:hypothetical protein
MKYKYFILLVVIVAMISGCTKEPSYLTGTWHVVKQVDSWYSGDSLIKQTTYLNMPVTWSFYPDRTGSIESCNSVQDFTYILEDDYLILTTSACPKSTWYIFERSNVSLAIEKVSLSGFVRIVYLGLE